MFLSIFLLPLLSKLILCYEESNESRYIDLLPEEEKEQFLERIARRILEEAKVKNNSNKHSVEITDDQLNEHNDFVNKIFKEESEKQQRGNNNLNNNENNVPVDDREVKNLTHNNVESDNGTNLKVLPVRTRRGNTIIEIPQNNNDETKHVLDHPNIEDAEISTSLVTTEHSVLKQVNDTDEKISINIEEGKSDTVDIQMNPLTKRESLPKIEDTTSTTDKDLEITKFNEKKFDLDPNSKKNVTEHLSEEKLDTVNLMQEAKSELTQSNNVNLKDKLVSHKAIFNFESIPLLNVSQMNINNSIKKYSQEIPIKDLSEDILQLNKTTPDIKSAEINSTNFRTNDDYNSTKLGTNVNHFQNITNNESLGFNYLSDSNGQINKNLYATKIYKTGPDFQVENVSRSDDNNSNIIHTTNETVENMKKIKPLAVSTTERSNLLKTKANDNNNEYKTSEIEADDSKIDIIKNLLRAVRLNFLKEETFKKGTNMNHNKKMMNVQNFEDKLKNRPKTYQVYEIPADKPVLTIRDHTKNVQNEEPYYAPIYNYSPNNAYFNAKNRYGPNYDDSSIERDIHGTTKDKTASNESHKSKTYYDQGKFRFENEPDESVPVNLKASEYFDSPLIRNIKFSENNFIPHDYGNINDYFDRSDVPYFRTDTGNKQTLNLPNSDEDFHPLNNLVKVKTHARAVKQILFNKNRFGHGSPLNSSEFKSAEESNKNESDKNESNKNETDKNENDKNKNETKPKTNICNPNKIYKREGSIPDDSDDMNTAEDFDSGQLKFESTTNHKNTEMKNDLISYLKEIRDKYLLSDVYKTIDEKKKEKSRGSTYETKTHNKDKKFKKPVIKYHGRNKDLLKIRAYQYTGPKPMLNTNMPYNVFKAIIKMTDDKDLLPVLEKLKALNITIMKKSEASSKLDAYVNVMQDMIQINSRALGQYDWLGSTVDIQAALKKLREITESLLKGRKIHPLDLQLLKYVIYLHRQSKALQLESELKQKRQGLRKRHQKKKKPCHSKVKGLINSIWLLRREDFEFTANDIHLFQKFLDDLQYALFGLHEALTQIATVTNVKNQRWFENLKELYLTGNRRDVLEIILHLSVTRLLGLVEENAAAMESDLEAFVKNNAEVIKSSKQEYKFVLDVLKEMNLNYLRLLLCIFFIRTCHNVHMTFDDKHSAVQKPVTTIERSQQMPSR